MNNDERFSIIIRDYLLFRVNSVQTSSNRNQNSLAVQSENFYKEFLNILLDCNLDNTGLNAAGIDLIDFKKHIVVQVSATCSYQKIQHSINLFSVPGDNDVWHFYFIPIMEKAPVRRKDYCLPNRLIFDKKTDVLDVCEIMRRVDIIGIDKQRRLSELTEKYSRNGSLDRKLREYLDSLLINTWEKHPSNLLMCGDKKLYNPSLSPKIDHIEQFERFEYKDEKLTERSVWNIIRESWEEERNRPIVIVGGSGIGKTVTLFDIIRQEDISVPAVYVPMYSLAYNNNVIDLSDYLFNLSKKTFGEKICSLATHKWDHGPSLLILLDGFNEVAGDMRIQVLNMLRKWSENNLGAQIIAVSRPMDNLDLNSAFSYDQITITLAPLTKAHVSDYLHKKNITPPKKNTPV